MSAEKLEAGILGIDAGGTFTDLAFICGGDSAVAAWGKTPTLHEDLVGTINEGLKIILQQVQPERIKAVNLATTLATNAIVENKIRSTGLILIGYDPVQVDAAIRKNKFGTDKVVMLGGGHDPKGNEAAPLEVEKLARTLGPMLAKVESVAVSGYFSVRNPSHEIKARDIIWASNPNMPVTCGHELASDLDAILRATTAALNAGLIPIVMDLFNSVERVFREYGIDVPISIVRGDGSLVSSEWAKLHPIETVLSGPAASAIGACHLAGADKFKRPSWVVDVGGTTTDIIYLDANGRPGLSSEGAIVGGHKTLIKAIDIYTFGLGGDSRVKFDKDVNLVVGPRRVKSLCSTADEEPTVLESLDRLAKVHTQTEPLIVRSGRGDKAESKFERSVVERVSAGHSTPDVLLSEERLTNMSGLQLEDMEARGIISFSGFTPTDALHVLGRLDRWNAKASELGAAILSRDRFPLNKLCGDVCKKVVHDIALNVLRKSLVRTGIKITRDGEAERLLSASLSDAAKNGPLLKPILNAAVVGVGAPAWAFLKEAGALLGEESILPENAGVAGAVGAAVGTFSLRYSVWVTPMADGTYRAHLPVGIRDYETLSEAVDKIKVFMTPWITERAKKTGAVKPRINCVQEDEEAWISGGLRKVHLWTQLWFNVVEDSES